MSAELKAICESLKLIHLYPESHPERNHEVILGYIDRLFLSVLPAEQHAEALRWLVNAAVTEWAEWRGVAGLRQIWSQRYSEAPVDVRSTRRYSGGVWVQ